MLPNYHMQFYEVFRRVQAPERFLLYNVTSTQEIKYQNTRFIMKAVIPSGLLKPSDSQTILGPGSVVSIHGSILTHAENWKNFNGNPYEVGLQICCSEEKKVDIIINTNKSVIFKIVGFKNSLNFISFIIYWEWYKILSVAGALEFR